MLCTYHDCDGLALVADRYATAAVCTIIPDVLRDTC